MPIKLDNRGEGNVISIPDHFLATYNGSIVINGNNNRITIGENCTAGNLVMVIGNDCTVETGRQVNFGALNVYLLRKSTLSIGNFSGFTWTCHIQAHEASDITIGEQCIFASDIWMSVSDIHPMYDRTTDERINKARPIRIGNKVWVGYRAMVLKGADLEDGAVIGAGSVVTGRVPAYCVAAGAPARVVRENVRWDVVMPHD